MTKRVAIYLRVSTSDKEQNPDNQLIPIQNWCKANDFEVVVTYVDFVSGSKGIDKRTDFAKMFIDASQRKFDLLVFWSLSRLSREGTRKTIEYLHHLETFGVEFKSFTEPYLSTENEIVRDVVISLLSAFAKQELEQRSMQIKAGQARARAEGKVIGRRTKITQDIHSKIVELASTEMSIRKIANKVDLPHSTISQLVRETRMDQLGSIHG